MNLKYKQNKEGWNETDHRRECMPVMKPQINLRHIPSWLTMHCLGVAALPLHRRRALYSNRISIIPNPYFINAWASGSVPKKTRLNN